MQITSIRDASPDGTMVNVTFADGHGGITCDAATLLDRTAFRRLIHGRFQGRGVDGPVYDDDWKAFVYDTYERTGGPRAPDTRSGAVQSGATS